MAARFHALLAMLHPFMSADFPSWTEYMRQSPKRR